MNISGSVLALCAFPSRTDWQVLRQDPAKLPPKFEEGLHVFGEGFPRPEFRHHRQHGWEEAFRKMQAQSSLRHHQMTLLFMIFLLTAGGLWQQRWCQSRCIANSDVDAADDGGLRLIEGHVITILSKTAGELFEVDGVQFEIPAGGWAGSDNDAMGEEGIFPASECHQTCATLSLGTWINYVCVSIPLVAMLVLVVFFAKVYVKHASTMIMVLLVLNFVAFVMFGKAKAETPPADLGWYSAVGMLLYAYFGGYMQLGKGVFGALLGSAWVVFNCLQKDFGPEMRSDLLVLHAWCHVPGIFALAAYERARRLYFGWWTLLRKSQEDKRGDAGPGRCEQVLYKLLPLQVTHGVNELKSLMSFEYPDGAILVADLGGFTSIVTPPEYRTVSEADGTEWMEDEAGSKVAMAMALLSDIVNVVMELAEKYDVMFTRMSGATIVLAAGLPKPYNSKDGRGNHASALAHLGHDLLGYVKELCLRRCEKVAKQENAPPDLGLGLRLGLAVGEVKAGLAGFHKFSYDVWGQAVEMADSLESTAQPGCLQCDDRAMELLTRTGDFSFGEPRNVLVAGTNPKPSYEVERVRLATFVEKPLPRTQRFWREHETEGEEIVINMVRVAETAALHEFVASLKGQTELRLTGKQGVQREMRVLEQQETMQEIRENRCGKEGFESASGWIDPVPDQLSNVADAINDYMQVHIDKLEVQHAEENEKMDQELKQQARDFLELLNDQRGQLSLGSRMNGVIEISSASRLLQPDKYNKVDAYVAVYWNGEHIGDTEVVKDDLKPVFNESKFDIDFYTQTPNELVLEVFDWDEGDHSGHTFLGHVTLKGSGVDFLPEHEENFKLMHSDDPAKGGLENRNVGGLLHLKFTPSHDREVEERMREVWMIVDEDGSGTLDRDETFAVLKKMGQKDIDMDKAMAELDEDQSGEVDFDEFRKWFFLQDTAAQGAMHKKESIATSDRIFEQVDIDGSGDVSYDEFTSWWTSRAKAKGELSDKELEEVLAHSLELFHKYDVDGGGGLDKEEFAAMIRDMAYEEWYPASSNGRQYFFNIKTKETRWTLPELGEELLDQFVDRQATLEVSGDKAATKLMGKYEEEIARQITESSDDPVVQRKIQTLVASKRVCVQQFVDSATVLFDSNAEMVDAFVRGMDEDVIEKQGALLKMKGRRGKRAEWKKRWVELHDAPRGRRLVYRQKPHKKEMHAVELVGCRYALGVWRSEENVCFEDEDAGELAPNSFTVIALEPFIHSGDTFYEEDTYTFKCNSGREVDLWIEALAIPEHVPPAVVEVPGMGDPDSQEEDLMGA